MTLYGEGDGTRMKITVDLWRVIADRGSKIVRGVGESGGQLLDLVVKFPSYDDEVTRMAERELKAWKRAKHPNVHELLYVCEIGRTVFFPRPEHQIIFVSRFMRNGTITEYIGHNPTADRLKLVLDLAKGLHYLHVVAMIVHGDIKPSNILIADDGRAMWTDFGLSTTVSAGSVPTEEGHRARCTPAFQAPELVDDSAENASEPGIIRSKTVKSDIFAFGTVIYLLYGGELTGTSGCRCMWQYDIANGRLPARPAQQFPDVVWEITTQSWARVPQERPSASSIFRMLSDQSMVA